MASYVKQDKHSIGFGLTDKEASADVYVNSCMTSLSNDTKNLFTKRREDIRPWMPKSNMLHLSGIGCLLYDNMKITETGTGKQVLVAATGDSIFYYLSELFGSKLSYSDIVCVLREEIDMFFRNISDEFVLIEEMPLIQVQQESVNFKPSVLYTTKFNFAIGCSEKEVGLRWHGEDCYYISQVDNSMQQITALYRLLYRSGYTIVNNELVELDEIAYPFE